MAQNIAVVVLVVFAISLLPAVILWGLLKLIDYGADEQGLAEIRNARAEGRTPDLSDSPGTAWQANTETGSPDGGVDVSDASAEMASAGDAEETVACSDCGRKNDAQFDMCWNCASRL